MTVADFPLRRVLRGESDLQANRFPRVSRRRLAHRLHRFPPFVSCHVRAFQNRHGRIGPCFRRKGSKPYPRDVIPGDPPRLLNPVHRSVPMPSVEHERLHDGACEQEEKTMQKLISNHELQKWSESELFVVFCAVS